MTSASSTQADVSAAFKPRSRRLVPFILLAIIAGLAPAITLLGVSRQRAIARSESAIAERVESALALMDRMFTEANIALEQLRESADDPVSDAAVARLQRAAYDSVFFREAGLINERGELVATSLGLVSPPKPIAAEERSRPEIGSMQIVGVVTTEVMGDESIIIGLPTRGQGEVTVLVDPSLLEEVFQQFPVGPGGFVEAAMIDGHVLARVGAAAPPSGAEQRKALSPPDAMVINRRSEKFPVQVRAHVDRDWALRDWYADLKWMTPLALAAAAGLAAVVLVIGSRPANLRDDLRIALRRDEFEAHYQPLIDLGTGRCIGAEALIRWKHPSEGYVRPDVFIGVAEESGLIRPITEWLIDRVAKDLGETLRDRDDLHIGINLAPDHFNSRDIIDDLRRILRPYQLPFERLTLEATERGMIGQDVALSRELMNDLRAMGVRIALDDFGTGYSSLAYLHTFKFDALKIDASFVRRIGVDSVGAGVIDAIIDLGHALDVTIIAEGVETKQQRDFLHTRGVHAAQGWLFAKAMPAAAFIELVRKSPAAPPIASV